MTDDALAEHAAPLSGDGNGARGSVDVDIVVAGAGAAGLAATLAAAPSATVLLVEANRQFQRACNTALSTSMIPAGGSRWQQTAGIRDSPEQFLADVRHKTLGSANAAVAEALTAVAPTLVEWLADDCAVPLELVTDFDYPGHSARRCHAVPDRSGATLHQALLRSAQLSPHVTLQCPARLVDVVTNADGAVVGVALEAPDGSQDSLTCRAVVLATNGFGADRDLVARYMPGIEGALYFGGEGSTGDALRIGERLGAQVADLDAYQGHGSVAIPQGILLTWAQVMHGGILVNALGERFGDESIGYSEFGEAVIAQPGGIAWAVFDCEISDKCEPFADYRRCAENGALRWASTLDELAAVTDTPYDALAATLESAGRATRGEIDPLGRTWWPRTLQSPYVAVKVTGALFHTQGGLVVDGQARVQRSDGQLNRLYAAGGAAVGMSGHGAAGYLAGNGLLSALGLGYLAGRSAGALCSGIGLAS